MQPLRAPTSRLVSCCYSRPAGPSALDAACRGLLEWSNSISEYLNPFGARGGLVQPSSAESSRSDALLGWSAIRGGGQSDSGAALNDISNDVVPPDPPSFMTSSWMCPRSGCESVRPVSSCAPRCWWQTCLVRMPAVAKEGRTSKLQPSCRDPKQVSSGVLQQHLLRLELLGLGRPVSHRPRGFLAPLPEHGRPGAPDVRAHQSASHGEGLAGKSPLALVSGVQPT